MHVSDTFLMAYIESVAGDLPPYSGRLCGACGFDAYPGRNREVFEEYSICDQCEAKAVALREDDDLRDAMAYILGQM